MNELLLIAGMTCVTFAIRYPIIILLGRITIPQPFVDALRFVPPAVLTAIIAPALLMPQGQLNFSVGNIQLWAGLLAILVAWRTRNLLLTIVVGMVGLWGLMLFR